MGASELIKVEKIDRKENNNECVTVCERREQRDKVRDRLHYAAGILYGTMVLQ